jgi:hypothetical protein
MSRPGCSRWRAERSRRLAEAHAHMHAQRLPLHTPDGARSKPHRRRRPSGRPLPSHPIALPNALSPPPLPPPRRAQHVDALLRRFPAKPINPDRSVFDLPLELRDGKATALRISLPPHFPQERPSLSVLLPVVHPAVDGTGRLHTPGLGAWVYGSSALVDVVAEAVATLTSAVVDARQPGGAGGEGPGALGLGRALSRGLPHTAAAPAHRRGAPRDLPPFLGAPSIQRLGPRSCQGLAPLTPVPSPLPLRTPLNLPAPRGQGARPIPRATPSPPAPPLAAACPAALAAAAPAWARSPPRAGSCPTSAACRPRSSRPSWLTRRSSRSCCGALSQARRRAAHMGPRPPSWGSREGGGGARWLADASRSGVWPSAVLPATSGCRRPCRPPPPSPTTPGHPS